MRAINSDIRFYKSASNSKKVYAENGRRKYSAVGLRRVIALGLRQQLATGPWGGLFPFLCLFLSSQSQGLDWDDSRHVF